ncbi:unnamed protein product [Ectocarpus sp. 12 AP-2014]
MFRATEPGVMNEPDAMMRHERETENERKQQLGTDGNEEMESCERDREYPKWRPHSVDPDRQRGKRQRVRPSASCEKRAANKCVQRRTERQTSCDRKEGQKDWTI